MATSIELRKINKKNVYRKILEEQVTSKQQLAMGLKLSIPTVTNILEDLSSEGLVELNGVFKSTGGRKAQKVSSIPEARVSIGLDITPNHITLVMVDLAGNILEVERERLRFSQNESYFRIIRNKIQTMVMKHSTTVLGINVSIPGIVSSDGEIIYAILLGHPVGLYNDLKKYLPYPFIILNDANASAFSELYGRDGINENDSFVYLMLSNTVGGAIVVNGSIVAGKGFRCGEFGHSILVPGGRKCYCGQKGHVDAYLSALCLSGQLEEFFKNLQEGNPTCKKKWDNYFQYLMVEVNNLQTEHDCEIVLGGYVGWYLKPYLNEIRNGVEELCTFQDHSIQISVGKYDYEAAALGAALLNVKKFIDGV